MFQKSYSPIRKTYVCKIIAAPARAKKHPRRRMTGDGGVCGEESEPDGFADLPFLDKDIPAAQAVRQLQQGVGQGQ